MTIFLSIFLVLALVAAIGGWKQAGARDKKVAAIKKKLAQVETERSFLLNQTTQLAQENVQLKSRLNLGAVSDGQGVAR